MLVKAAGGRKLPRLEVEGSHPKNVRNPVTLGQSGGAGHSELSLFVCLDPPFSVVPSPIAIWQGPAAHRFWGEMEMGQPPGWGCNFSWRQGSCISAFCFTFFPASLM